MQKKSEKKKFMDRMVAFSAAMIVLFTIAAIVLQFVTSVELSGTLITCWYAFWTAEIFSLVSIKNTNTKHKKRDESKEDGEG